MLTFPNFSKDDAPVLARAFAQAAIYAAEYSLRTEPGCSGRAI